MHTFRLLTMIVAVALVGCGKKSEQPQNAMPGMQGMPGMSGMSGAMKSDALMPMMRADLDSLARRSSRLAAGTLTAHETMTSEMLDAMARDMTMMHMTPDAAWGALSDSVKRDLADLPSLSGKALETRIMQHAQRMGRLLDMHQRMMSARGK
jgi:hypothetical protein